MNPHRAVIEAGPASVRRLCCDTKNSSRSGAAALDGIDDPVALLDERPVAVELLWSQALRSLAEGHRGGPIVVHPSWWSAARVGVLAAAASGLGGGTLRPRSWLLAQGQSHESTVSIEIADRLVAIVGPEVVAVPRRTESLPVAGAVAEAVETMLPGASVCIDTPAAIPGARLLAQQIASVLTSPAVVTIDDAGLARQAAAAAVTGDPPRRPPTAPPGSGSRVSATAAVVAAGIVAAVLVVAAPTTDTERPRRSSETQPAPTKVLVEGRVALTVPATWLTQRVIAGPGSARVQVTSPADPEVALHITQSPTPGETLARTAERLKRAMDSEPAGVFVDFNPAGLSAGRPAVTYREVRAGHDVRWAVLMDGSTRISVGCQSRPHAQDAVRDACEQAVRSVHAVE
ncbi:type VII secretion-associated protein [Mycobacterium asiaticum]|uniref:Type VII secretion-associated protein n=1 Tax=Mycobacterium asiaticum TaxID=1790 RepID=A0A1A3N1C6_MYCAS|nr:type VII secretion-associated protein [Mycobacterium asiaticum]OBK15160.1 type VII secretion-associated protein [Mycobacterium asiaticum]